MAINPQCSCGKGKKLGCASVGMIVECGTAKYADILVANFGGRARGKSLEIVTLRRLPSAKAHVFPVEIEYRHTCHNGGNLHSDAKRFVQKAFLPSTARFTLKESERNKWVSLPCPDEAKVSI